MPSYAVTPYQDVNEMLTVLVSGMQEILGDQLLGVYLDGSLASGGFDEDSDIDFVAITRDEIPEKTFMELQAMHDRLSRLDSPWAIQLEGSYISQYAARRTDPAFTLYPNIERGMGERLKLARHGDLWNIHRYLLRERGIIILGPDPRTLIDPVFPDQLRQAMRPMLFEWLGKILQDPTQVKTRGYQSYIVLTICRILYTLANGAVASKPEAVRWAKVNLGQRWAGLIERAWVSRHHSDGPASAEEMQETLDFIRFALEKGR